MSLFAGVLVLAFMHCFAVSASSQTVCYVRPDDGNTTCPRPCYTLQEYADDQISVEKCKLGTSNTVYVFLEGVHQLLGNISLNFFNTDTVSLVGNRTTTENTSHPTVLITCNDRAGFFFRNATNIVIRDLNITGCGHWYGYMKPSGQATLAFNNVINVTISSVGVRNSTGYGLNALCAIGYVKITHSVFAYNEGTAYYDGGNVNFLYKNCNYTKSLSFLLISFSQFLYGCSEHINPLATGLSVFVWSNRVNVEIDNITAIGNVGRNNSTGGNIAIFLRNRTNILSNWITVKNSYIADGRAYEGAGMYVSILDTPPYDAPNNNSLTRSYKVMVPEIVTITNTHFVGNQGLHEGGGLYLLTHADAGIMSPIGNVTIRDCVFYNNSLQSEIGGGVALHLSSHYVLAYLNHSEPQFYVSVINSRIENNVLITNNSVFDTVSTASSAVYIMQRPAGVLLDNCSIINNTCTGIGVVWSSVIFAGYVEIINNTGTDGGGIIMCDNSFMLLRANTTLLVKDNTAHHAGGGIFAENSCLQAEPPCFFQLDIEIYKYPPLQDTVHVQLIDNRANYAGTAIYGGSVDYCYLFPQFEPDLKRVGAEMFKHIFKIVHDPNDLSPISSDAYQVCFCSKNGSWPDCHVRSIVKSVYPGKQLSIQVLTVGQYDGSSSHSVLASLTNSTFSKLGDGEDSQPSQYNCTQFKYTVFSSLPSEMIVLRVKHSGISSIASRKGYALVNVTLMNCPIGFIITDVSPYKCDCVPILRGHVQCDIQHEVIVRPPHAWIGYCSSSSGSSHNPSNHSSKGSNDTTGDHGVCFQHHCPYDFCKYGHIKIKTGPQISDFEGDVQCSYNRTGILCGACRPGYSLILGNPECRKCTDTGLLLLLIFIIAGLLLVLLLILTDLNVSSGTMSGLILYANLVQVNRAIFFGGHVSSTPVYLCSIFIAWLNLDFGIAVCFFEGMDAYTKTWLQFLFPLYVWAIAVVIILLSRRFPSIAGRNPVRVLATLILLSYAKLLRTSITSLIPIELSLSTADGGTVTRLVWREDGNMDYLQWKHAILFTVAFGFGLVTLPYALVLFFVQWIQKTSSNCFMCSWLVKMKPFFDAYTGPYKIHCRFWTGFLLLIRVLLFAAFALPHIYPDIKLLLIIFTCILVQTIAWSFHGVFNSRYTDGLNSIHLLNLGLFSIVTSYTYNTGNGNQDAMIIFSVGTAFVMFIFSVIFLQIRVIKRWNHLEVWFRGKQFPQFKRGHRQPTTPWQQDEDDSEVRLEGVTHTTIDCHYREPLIGSSRTNSYGSVN